MKRQRDQSASSVAIAGQQPLPPFARDLLRRRQAGGAINLFIYAGPRAWKMARLRIRYNSPTLVLPVGDDPSSYRWPVQGLEIALIWPEPGNRHEVISFGRLLVVEGAALVSAVFGDPDGPLFFQPLRGRRMVA
jgi:hypothetical protein